MCKGEKRMIRKRWYCKIFGHNWKYKKWQKYNRIDGYFNVCLRCGTRISVNSDITTGRRI